MQKLNLAMPIWTLEFGLFGVFYWQERKTYRGKNVYLKNSIAFVESESIL